MKSGRCSQGAAEEGEGFFQGGNMAARLLALISIFVAALCAQVGQPTQPQHTVDPELQRVVEQFVKAVDNGDVAAVAAAYSPEFLNVRVADDGGFARLSRAQIR